MWDTSAVLIKDAGGGSVPYGTLHPALLDAATYGIPTVEAHRIAAGGAVAAGVEGIPAHPVAQVAVVAGDTCRLLRNPATLDIERPSAPATAGGRNHPR